LIFLGKIKKISQSGNFWAKLKKLLKVEIVGKMKNVEKFTQS